MNHDKSASGRSATCRITRIYSMFGRRMSDEWMKDFGNVIEEYKLKKERAELRNNSSETFLLARKPKCIDQSNNNTQDIEPQANIKVSEFAGTRTHSSLEWLPKSEEHLCAKHETDKLTPEVIGQFRRQKTRRFRNKCHTPTARSTEVCEYSAINGLGESDTDESTPEISGQFCRVKSRTLKSLCHSQIPGSPVAGECSTINGIEAPDRKRCAGEPGNSCAIHNEIYKSSYSPTTHADTSSAQLKNEFVSDCHQIPSTVQTYQEKTESVGNDTKWPTQCDNNLNPEEMRECPQPRVKQSEAEEALHYQSAKIPVPTNRIFRNALASRHTVTVTHKVNENTSNNNETSDARPRTRKRKFISELSFKNKLFANALNGQHTMFINEADQRANPLETNAECRSSSTGISLVDDVNCSNEHMHVNIAAQSKDGSPNIVSLVHEVHVEVELFQNRDYCSYFSFFLERDD